MLDAETLAQRLEFCQGSELLSTLEELDALAVKWPSVVGPVAVPALMNLLKDANTAGAEATQQAVEVVSRLATGSSRMSGGQEKATLENGELLATSDESATYAARFVDLMESEACETYTTVVVLELLASLCAVDEFAGPLRKSLLGAPAGGARLMETVSDAREEVRNASVALWRRLCDGVGLDSDEFRVCCAFNDGFAKIFRVLDEGSPRVQRDCFRLLANVLRGPPVVATMLAEVSQDHGLRPFAPILRELTEARLAHEDAQRASENIADDDDEGDDENISERKQSQQQHHRRVLEAAKTAACVMEALRAFLLASESSSHDEGSTTQQLTEQVKEARRAALWAAESTRSALVDVALALSDDDKEDPEDDDSSAPRVLLQESDVFGLADDDYEATAIVAVEAASVRAYEILALSVTEAASVDLVQNASVFGKALRSACGPDSIKARAAAKFAKATFRFESAAALAVMHAVAPPPPMDEDEIAAEPAVQQFTDALFKNEKATRRRPGLEVFRCLLASSAAVRELGLKLTVTLKDDEPRTLLSLLVERTCFFSPSEEEEEDKDDLSGLAILVVWLQDAAAAAHALFQDPYVAAGLAKAAKAKKSKQRRGLACVVLALCLDHFDDVDRHGWTKETLQTLVDKRIGTGPFA